MRKARSTHPLGLWRLQFKSASRPWQGMRGFRLRTRCSIALPDYRDAVYEKPRLLATLAPQLVGAEVAHVRRALPAAAWMPLRAARPKSPTAEALENQGGLTPTMIFKAEAASPSSVYRVLSGKEGWRHLGRAEGPTSWGAILLYFKAFYSSSGVQAVYPCLYPSIRCISAYRTRVRYPVS